MGRGAVLRRDVMQKKSPSTKREAMTWELPFRRMGKNNWELVNNNAVCPSAWGEGRRPF